MKRYDLLPPAGRFYKANLHCHTTVSDGHLSPEECKKAYQKAGYSVLAFTDHREYRWHKELTDPDFLVLAGYEVNINKAPVGNEDFATIKTYHINLFDTKPDFHEKNGFRTILPACSHEDHGAINAYIQTMKEQGFLACYNHPYWSLHNYEDYCDLHGLFAMEIYNHGCEKGGMYGFSPQVYDDMVRTGQRIFCVAADDNHNGLPFNDPGSDSFGGFIMIKAECLEYNAIMKALQNGDFYYSTGPEIYEIYVEDRKLYVITSPVKAAYVIQQGRRCHRVLASDNSTVETSVFELNGREGYIRFICRDEKGKYAGTSAFFNLSQWLESID